MKILCFSDPHQLVKDTFPSFKLAPSKSRQILPGLAYAVTTSVGAVSHLKLWHSYICVIINLLWGIIFFLPFHNHFQFCETKDLALLQGQENENKSKQQHQNLAGSMLLVRRVGERRIQLLHRAYICGYICGQNIYGYNMWLEMTTLFSLAWPIFGS